MMEEWESCLDLISILACFLSISFSLLVPSLPQRLSRFFVIFLFCLNVRLLVSAANLTEDVLIFPLLLSTWALIISSYVKIWIAWIFFPGYTIRNDLIKNRLIYKINNTSVEWQGLLFNHKETV